MAGLRLKSLEAVDRHCQIGPGLELPKFVESSEDLKELDPHLLNRRLVRS